MKELIRHILKEQSSKIKLLKVIEDEGIFAAAELVGGMDNLKRILKDEPEITDIIGSLKGKLDLVYHSRKEYLEFPMGFEIVGKGINNHKTNSWPIVNLIYDDSKLSESEKKLFEQFVYDSIGDFNITNVKKNPKTLKMFRERGDYMGYKYVNGKDWETLDHDIRYDDNDIKNIHREYYTKSYMNESKDETQNKKVKLVKQMIYDLFDEVTDIEESTYLDKPFLTIYFKTDSKAANITSWFSEYITDEIYQITGDNIVVLPYWTFYWDPRLKNVDIYINTKQHDEDNNVINESRILQENEEDPTQKILNFLLRRYKVIERNLGDDDNPILHKVIMFEINGETYSINNFQNKKQQAGRIFEMLIENNVIDPIDIYERQLNPYTQKVIRAIKTFIDQAMPDKSNINESKIVDKIKSFFGKKPLTKEEMKDERLMNVIVRFINETYTMEGTRDEFGTVTIYLTDEGGNTIYPPIMKYYPDNKILEYSWEFTDDIYNMIGDKRLLKLDSELMGKIFEKLFKKKINKVYGYSRL